MGNIFKGPDPSEVANMIDNTFKKQGVSAGLNILFKIIKRDYVEILHHMNVDYSVVVKDLAQKAIIYSSVDCFTFLMDEFEHELGLNELDYLRTIANVNKKHNFVEYIEKEMENK